MTTRFFTCVFYCLLLASDSTVKLVNAYPSGAGACLVGQASPGAAHRDASSTKTVVNTTLEKGGFYAVLGGRKLVASKLKGKIPKIQINTNYVLMLTGKRQHKGSLLAVTAVKSVSNPPLIAPANTTITQVATACSSQTVTNTSGITHVNNNLKKSSAGTLVAFQPSNIWLDLNIVTVNNSTRSEFYYTQIQVQAVSKCSGMSKSCVKSNDCCLGLACIYRKNSNKAKCKPCQSKKVECSSTDECCQGLRCKRVGSKRLCM